MNWTQSDKDVVEKYIKAFGKPDIAALTFWLKTKTRKAWAVSDVRTLVKLVESQSSSRTEASAPLGKDAAPRDVRGTCRDIINEVKAEIKKQPKRKVPEKLSHHLTPLLFLSDLHIGETIEVNGIQIFNLDIAQRGLKSIIDQVLDAPEYYGYSMGSIIVVLGGDIIDGELIYPAQGFSTPQDAFSQCKIATKIIWEQLQRLAQKFVSVEVKCVPGNHGRTSKLHSQMSNWDNVLYHNLKLIAEMSGESIFVETPDQMWMDFNVHQWTVHIRHIGVPQASSAGGAKKAMVWLNNHNADLLFFGHYHSPEMFSCGYKKIFKNGALPPANDYAENLGFLDGPGQWLVGITYERPVAFTKIIIPDTFGA